MVNSIEGRILIDSEKVEKDGNQAYRLFLYDTADGTIKKVISFVDGDDIVLNRPQPKIEEEVNPMQEFSQLSGGNE